MICNIANARKGTIFPVIFCLVREKSYICDIYIIIYIGHDGKRYRETCR